MPFTLILLTITLSLNRPALLSSRLCVSVFVCVWYSCIHTRLSTSVGLSSVRHPVYHTIQYVVRVEFSSVTVGKKRNHKPTSHKDWLVVIVLCMFLISVILLPALCPWGQQPPAASSLSLLKRTDSHRDEQKAINSFTSPCSLSENSLPYLWSQVENLVRREFVGGGGEGDGGERRERGAREEQWE